MRCQFWNKAAFNIAFNILRALVFTENPLVKQLTATLSGFEILDDAILIFQNLLLSRLFANI